MPSLQVKRGTRSQLNAAGSLNQLKEGEIYYITDESRLAVGLSTSTYQALLKQNEGGAGGDVEYNELILLLNSSPSTNSGASTLFTDSFYGRSQLGYVNSDGEKAHLQNDLISRVVQIIAPGSSTSLAYMNMPTVPAVVGTLSHPTPNTTDYRQGLHRAQLLGSTTANRAVEVRTANMFARTGSTTAGGGFFMSFRFGIGSSVSTQRWLVGLVKSTATLSTSLNPPAVSTDFIFIGSETGDTNFSVFHRGNNATVTKIPLGTDFNKGNIGSVIEFTLYCAPTAATTVRYMARRVDNTSLPVVSGTISSNIPAATIFLQAYFYCNNGGTAAAVTMDFIRFYRETILG